MSIWPQLTLGAIYAVSLGVTIAQAASREISMKSFLTGCFVMGINLMLLHAGGFWSPLGWTP